VDVRIVDDAAPVRGGIFEAEAAGRFRSEFFGLASAMTLRTGIAGAGQKNMGMAAYAREWALPMKPPPMRPTLRFCM
jgi:hypothetical protein